MFASLTRIARSLRAHTRSFLPGMRLRHNQSSSARRRRTRVQRWHLVPKRYFTKNNAMFLIWTVIAMAFRVSSSGAIELQTATFISTTYQPVSQFWGRHRHFKPAGDCSPRQVAKLRPTAEFGQERTFNYQHGIQHRKLLARISCEAGATANRVSKHGRVMSSAAMPTGAIRRCRQTERPRHSSSVSRARNFVRPCQKLCCRLAFSDLGPLHPHTRTGMSHATMGQSEGRRSVDRRRCAAARSRFRGLTPARAMSASGRLRPVETVGDFSDMAP